MGMFLKIDCNANTIVGLQEAFRAGVFPDYESTPWIKREYTRNSLIDTIFNEFETALWLPQYTIRKVRVVINTKGSYAGRINLNTTPSISKALAGRTMDLAGWEEGCKNITFIFNLIKGKHVDPANEVVSLDGFIASLLSGGNMPLNSFAINVSKRFEDGTTPDKLLQMDGLRHEFVRYVNQRHKGNFAPTETDLLKWLKTKGINEGVLTPVKGAMDHYSLANRYQLFTMDEQSFQEWVQNVARNSTARYVATSLLATAEVELGTAMYELGYVASESVAYEIIGYICALLLI